MNDAASSIDPYLNRTDALFGAGEYFKVTSEAERPHVWVVTYRDVPDEGSLTALTYGLSSIDHPLWKVGRPEVLISVNSSNPDWALAAGFLVKRYRGSCPFSMGNVLRFGSSITAESQMSAFFVFASSLLSPDEGAISLPDRRVNVVQIYPIYEEEIGLIEQEGVPAFFGRDGVDFVDVQRRNLGEGLN